MSATQNMGKYTRIEILKVFTNFSYCFILYAFAITSNTLLTSSCTVHSRKFPTKAIGTCLQMLVYAIL